MLGVGCASGHRPRGKATSCATVRVELKLGLGVAFEGGVPKQRVQAFQWFRKAADQGHAKAQYCLGLMHDLGEVVAQDRAQAVKFYRLAAAQGHVKAQYTLAERYDRGRGVAQNDIKAHLWFNLAAVAGDANAFKYRNYTAKSLSAEQVAAAQKLATECQAKLLKGCD
jgi:TPR repeat protein